jgi:hypothetical protein
MFTPSISEKKNVRSISAERIKLFGSKLIAIERRPYLIYA